MVLVVSLMGLFVERGWEGGGWWVVVVLVVKKGDGGGRFHGFMM